MGKWQFSVRHVLCLLHQLRKELKYMFMVNRTFSTLLSFDIFYELDPILLLLSGLFPDFLRSGYFIFELLIDFGMLCASINA